MRSSESPSQSPSPTGASPLETVAAVFRRALSILRRREFWRFVFVVSLASTAILVLLGPMVWLVAWAILMLILRISPVSAPAGRIIAALAGLPRGERLIPQYLGPSSGKLMLLWPLLIWASIAAYGLWLLLTRGFLSQNLIYMLLVK